MPFSSSLNAYPGPPDPVPVGSPHWTTKMLLVTSRWHGVLLKNFCRASETKLFTVHGAAARSSRNCSVPWLVATRAVTVPEAAALVGGRATFRAALPDGR